MPIDFWFSIGSIYAYLTVMRIDRVAQSSGVSFRWRPFSIRAIMIEMDNRPMSKPVKLDYMWRDTERRAERYGFPFPQRPPYPLKNFDLVNKIALVGAAEGWCEAYTRAAYRRWFLGHEEIGDERSNVECLQSIGQGPDRVVQRAMSEEIGRAYDEATAQARALRIFGVPSFVTRDEVFWGDDRLDDAIRWHRDGALKAS
jgi:2-hydroxychromene-2-carboxylate isomerase